MRDVPFDPEDWGLVADILSIPAFKPLGVERLAEVMPAIAIRDYDEGERVITRGALDKTMYFLMSGRLKVMVDNLEVGDVEGAGAVFGEMGVIDNQPRSASVVVREPARCLALDVNFFDRLEGRAKLAVQAFFYKMFYEVLVERLRATNGRVADLDMQRFVMENMDID